MKAQTTKSWNSIILIIITIAFAYYYILPSASINTNYSVALIGVVVSVLLISVLLNSHRISVEVLLFAIAVVFISTLYIFLTDTKAIASDVSNYNLKRFTSKAYQMLMMFFPVFLYKSVRNHCTKRQKTFILFIAYAFIIFVVVQTMIELVVNPNITRIWLKQIEAGQKNVAGYYFVYAVPFVIVFCWMMFLQSKRRTIKVLLGIIIAFLFYFLFLCQYTISVLISVIGIIACMLLNGKGGVRIVVVIGITALFVLTPFLIKSIIPFIESKQVSERLNEIVLFFESGDIGSGNLRARFTLYQKSIMAFFSSPIWGNRSLDFDGHATFLTILADLGLLGALPYYYLYHRSKRLIYDSVGKQRFLPFFIILVICGLLNPIHAALPLMFVVWFVSPLSIELFARPEDQI